MILIAIIGFLLVFGLAVGEEMRLENERQEKIKKQASKLTGQKY
jgi:hypothetical protein